MLSKEVRAGMDDESRMMGEMRCGDLILSASGATNDCNESLHGRRGNQQPVPSLLIHRSTAVAHESCFLFYLQYHVRKAATFSSC